MDQSKTKVKQDPQRQIKIKKFLLTICNQNQSQLEYSKEDQDYSRIDWVGSSKT